MSVVARVLLVALLALGALTPAAAVSGASEAGRLYLVPFWLGLTGASDAEVAASLATLRTRIGEGGPVRAGFTTYIRIDMTAWPVSTEAQATAALAPTIARLDRVLALARAHDFPLALVFVTALRADMDAAQAQSQDEDRRVMQWFDDNRLATGWWTLSRYARQQAAVRDLYFRALGRIVANRMATYPDVLVAASGDAEVELAFPPGGNPDPGHIAYADYSPFAVAEFRDWLRGTGLFAPGQPLAGQAYALATRYTADPSPAVDSGDGHTLNGDFATTFTTWDLRYFNWTLTDATGLADPRRIPVDVYGAPDFEPLPGGTDLGFDPPRTKGVPDSAWWQVWRAFRQHLVHRYNLDVARAMTTSPDPVTGLTIPAGKWFSNQIPADYLYGHTPASPDIRFLTSASAWSTADIRPYGGAGFTAFNTRDGDTYFRTLASLAPLADSLGVPWGLFEWNPSIPATPDAAIYREDVARVEAYRPRVVAPFAWDLPDYAVLDSGFEPALREMVQRLRGSPWNLQGVVSGTTVRLTWTPPDSGPVDTYRLEVGSTLGATDVLMLDTGSRSTVFTGVGATGTYFVRVRALVGGVWSAPSNDARIVLGGAAPPAAPAGLSALVSGSTITFNWLAPATGTEVAGYRLEAGSAPGLANLAVLPLGPTTTFTIGDVPGGVYFVQVRAVNGAGASPPGNALAVTSSAGSGHCTPVAVPPAVAFTLSGRTVSFEWLPPDTGAAPTGYVLEALSPATREMIATLPLGPSRAFAVTAPPGSYLVRLRAVGTCGVSAPGAEVRLDVS